MISSGFPILSRLGSRRFCRPMCAVRSALMIVLCRAGSSMRCAVAVAGPTAPLSTGRRRRSATASSAGPSAVYGKVSSALRQAPRIRPTGCSSTAPASRFIAAPAAEKGGLGPWYRPHRRRTQHRAPRRPRPQGPPLRPAPDARKRDDCKVAQRCIEAMPPSAEPVAGKGRDGREMRERLEERGIGPVIPPRKNRKIRYHYDQAIYRERNIIECM